MVSVASGFKKIFWRRRKVVPSCQGNAIAVDISDLREKIWTSRLTAMTMSQYLYFSVSERLGEACVISYGYIRKKLYMYIQPCSERRWFLERENILKRKIRAHLSKVRAGCCPGRPQGHKISLVTSSIWGEHQCVFRTLVKQTISLY